METDNPTFLVGLNGLFISSSATCCGIKEVGQFAYESAFYVGTPFDKQLVKRSPETRCWWTRKTEFGLTSLLSNFDPDTEIAEIPLRRYDYAGNWLESLKDAPRFQISISTFADLVLTYLKTQYIPEMHYEFYWGLDARRVQTTGRMVKSEKIGEGYKAWEKALIARGLDIVKLGRSRMDDYPLYLGVLLPYSGNILSSAAKTISKLQSFRLEIQKLAKLDNEDRERNRYY